MRMLLQGAVRDEHHLVARNLRRAPVHRLIVLPLVVSVRNALKDAAKTLNLKLEIVDALYEPVSLVVCGMVGSALRKVKVGAHAALSVEAWGRARLRLHHSSRTGKRSILANIPLKEAYRER